MRSYFRLQDDCMNQIQNVRSKRGRGAHAYAARRARRRIARALNLERRPAPEAERTTTRASRGPRRPGRGARSRRWSASPYGSTQLTAAKALSSVCHLSRRLHIYVNSRSSPARVMIFRRTRNVTRAMAWGSSHRMRWILDHGHILCLWYTVYSTWLMSDLHIAILVHLCARAYTASVVLLHRERRRARCVYAQLLGATDPKTRQVSTSSKYELITGRCCPLGCCSARTQLCRQLHVVELLLSARVPLVEQLEDLLVGHVVAQLLHRPQELLLRDDTIAGGVPLAEPAGEAQGEERVRVRVRRCVWGQTSAAGRGNKGHIRRTVERAPHVLVRCVCARARVGVRSRAACVRALRVCLRAAW